MHIKKVKAKSDSLNKILKVVESKKNITLINILKLSKQINFYFERANQSRILINELSKSREIDVEILKPSTEDFFSGIKKLFYKKKEIKKQSHNNLWIYVTEEEKFQTNSYDKHEKSILKYMNKGDSFIAIGKKAITFVDEHKLNKVLQFEENNVETLSKQLPSFIFNFLKMNGFHRVRFVINSSKIKQNFQEVLPLNEINFNLKSNNVRLEEQVKINKLNIYPNINSFIESELYSYLTYVSLTLLSESALIYQKYMLVSQNQKINDLEKKQKQLKLKIIRVKRENEVEEMSLISSKKDLLHSNIEE
ncbi:MSC_0622 family F1-like ATPase gamma subunit [Mycoplasmopsis adleri]|uniref:MSC_0622 family F1-like ATPase gamma subunit n=1 Tax=Mycoplasmopsis adleri TaxID=51362 RepID=UPI003873368B